MAASSRVDIVTVGVAGSIITLTPVNNGTTTVTVTARDPGGLSATQTTAVTVRDTGGWQRAESGPAILDPVVRRWTDTAPVGGATWGATPIRAAHVTELRAAVVVLE